MNCAISNTTIISRLRHWNMALIGWALAATFAAIVGCGGEPKYSEQTRTKFLNICGGYETSEWCLCFLDGIEANYSEEEFIAWTKSSDQVPAKWFEIDAACREDQT